MAGLEKSFHLEGCDVDPALEVEMKKVFNGPMYLSHRRYGPKGYLLPRQFDTVGRDIYNMEVRPDDTFVVTFPKSGTTWTQDMVWLIANNFDYDKAINTSIDSRYPFLDSAMFLSPEVQGSEMLQNVMDVISVPNVNKLADMPSPRFIKSHLPLSVLPPKLLDTCKVVYVARDPRDVAVSFFHHVKLMRIATDNMEFKVYWNLFIRDLVPLAPLFAHIKEAWELRDHPNMLFLFYEELSKDLPSCVRRAAQFLGKEITDGQVEKLCDHLNFDNFKKNKSVNLDHMKGSGFLNEKESFIRKGKVGGWRDYLDEEMTEQAERWIEENLRDTDLRFPQ